MKLRCVARTDGGKVREQNEDSYGLGAHEQANQLGMLLLVCDGMGGHAAGEVASRRAVDTIMASYYADPRVQRAEVLEAAFVQANRDVYTEGRGTMGTTGVAALLYHNTLHIANVGDSRAYLVRNTTIHQLSRDHSLVADQVEAGLLTPEQARVSMVKNVITRALGYQARTIVDVFRFPLQVGDIVLLCSDGLHGLVSDNELTEIATAHPPDDAAQQLIDLANERGGSDNITVALAYVDVLDAEAQDIVGESQSDPHERVTEPLARTTRPLPIEELDAQPEAMTPATTLLVSAPTERNAATLAPIEIERSNLASAPTTARTERPLRLLGALLSLILFTALLFTILLVSNNASTNATLTPTASSAPTTSISSATTTSNPPSSTNTP